MDTQTTTEEVNATETNTEPTKRNYTKKEDMVRGNNAILETLPNGEDGALSKNEILAKLDQPTRELVERNWNLRIQFLEESGEVLTKGRKVAKKYFRPV